ncbi:MAG: hypothetical protein O2954_09015 [bacterium]|nr:hypothetical protein [bacterium]
MRPSLIFYALVVLLAGVTQVWAQAKVIKVDNQVVHVGVGGDREVKVGMQADVYRQAEPIIHPVTGANLGSPKVRIARIEIRKVGPTFSSARYIEKYVPVEVGDLVEGLEVAPTLEEEIRSDVVQARAEIKMLAQSLADEIKGNKKAISDLRGTLQRIAGSEKRLDTLIRAVRNMREQMVVMDGRIGHLEQEQMALIQKDTAEVKMMGMEDMHELKVLRRGDADDVYLTVGDRMYRLSFETNTLVEEPMVQPAAMGSMPPGAPVEPLFPEEEMIEEEGSGWMSYWWIAPVLGLVGAVVLFLLKAMKRKEEAPEEEDDGGFVEAEDDDLGEDLDLPEPEEVGAADNE